MQLSEEARKEELRAKKRAAHKRWRDANREHVRQYARAKADKRNADRRAAYARDEERRIAARKQARVWQEKNPGKRFEQRVRVYGITSAEYGALLEAQGGGCAICGRTESKDISRRSATGKRRLHIDHCHATGRVRGLLCSSCNLGIGKFGESIEALERAIMYLRKQADPRDR